MSSPIQGLKLALGYIGHNIALLALPLVVAAVALAWSPRGWTLLKGNPRAFIAGQWSRAPNPGAPTHQAWNIWIVQAIVAVGPLYRGVNIFDLPQDRLGHFAVLPDAACDDRNSSIARGPGRAGTGLRDLAGNLDDRAGRSAADRHHHDAAQCRRSVHL